MDELRRAAGQKLLDTAQEFWDACHKEKQYGAIQWLTGTNGELIIYTRGEYRQQLLQNIHTLPDQVEYFFEEMPKDEEE